MGRGGKWGGGRVGVGVGVGVVGWLLVLWLLQYGLILIPA